VPPLGCLRVLQAIDEYCFPTFYEVGVEGGPAVDCQLATGRVVEGRRDWFGWVSWQRMGAGRSTGMCRSPRCTAIRYQDDPGADP